MKFAIFTVALIMVEALPEQTVSVVQVVGRILLLGVGNDS
jgi:hypothetical protein